MDSIFTMDKLKEECGVIGIYAPGQENISQMLCFGLIALQHRGQESAGIAVLKDRKMQYYKEMGLVQEVFNSEILDRLPADIGVGHVRYSTTGESYVSNAQPLVVRYKGGSIALAHNGNLVNASVIRDRLEDEGSIFQTSIDSEVIANLIAKNYHLGMKEAIIESVKEIRGSFAMVIIIDNMLIGVRDPHGLRPLSLAKLNGGYVLASETCAHDVVGAEFIRDIEPGEIVVIDDNGIESIQYDNIARKALCCFEYVYFARPDSIIDGVNVYMSRKEAGRILARENPVEADMVIAVPDSGIAAAIGYAEESGIPYDTGLIKNKYMGRTFIQPDQKSRELAVRLKLNVMRDNIEGKRLILIDDSIVRGTTSRRIVNMLKEAGAKEVHIRVSSPPVKHSCYFGIDTPSRKQLVGATHTLEQIRDMIGADSLAYLTVDGLVKSIGMAKSELCTACFNGDYPMAVPQEGNKYIFEKC
ncbi:amidophosphoribosyltransferase [Fusibacter paucivorans]|uniref:Amidophosphoribosyltransferase n=1 Tax=Fusibacter paucivorans TaxID=76009 RepID=A0ABS5PRL8_9FIRM|nr:amidophosphoribosyltransferase [Fusibacter paucivorans]MBS7527803.1 amidophosphoribosyltransferase [Fusibacter paucivorans]